MDSGQVREAWSGSKNVAAFFKVGVEREQGTDNRKVHHDGKQYVREYIEEAYDKGQHLK